MAFNPNKPLVSYIAQTNQTVFDFDFKVFVASDIVINEVTLTPETILVNPSEYSVTINGDLGGSITFNTARTAGFTIIIKRELPVNRAVEYQENGDLKAVELNADQDYQTYLIADNASNNDNFYHNDPKSVGVSTTMPLPTPKGKLVWSEDGKSLENDNKNYLYSLHSTVSPILPDPKKDSILGWNAAENALTNITFTETDVAVDVNYVRTSGVATNGQQDISTVPYTTTNAQVFLNGSLLVLNNDYTSYKSTITMITPMEVGDEYTVLVTGIPNEGLPTDYNKMEFISTAGQTVFNGPDTAVNVEVYVNGTIYPSSDYTLNGGTVTFNNGLEEGDEVIIISGIISTTTATAAVQYVLGVGADGAINRTTGEQVIQYTYSETPEYTTYTIEAKQNAFSVDSLTVSNGSSIVIEDEATYKVI